VYSVVSATRQPVSRRCFGACFDRLLVYQAIEHNLALVTGDPVVRSYPVRTLWT